MFLELHYRESRDFSVMCCTRIVAGPGDLLQHLRYEHKEDISAGSDFGTWIRSINHELQWRADMELKRVQHEAV